MNAHVTPTSGTKSLAKTATLRAEADFPGTAKPAPSAAALQPDSGMGATAAFIEPERRRAMVAEAAYYRAAGRGFEPGRELEDWYLAEGEVDAMLARGEIPALSGGDELL